MTEIEGADWDPDAWLEALRSDLQDVGEGYLRSPIESDEPVEFLYDHWPHAPFNRTSFAWLAIQTVLNRLAALPGMKGNAGFVPIHDTVAAMMDLSGGGKPALLQPTRAPKRGNEKTARRWVRQHALLFVGLLVKSGVSADGAAEFVAKELARSGHKNRKRDGGPVPLSKAAVLGWWNASRQPDFAKTDPKMSKFIERNQPRVMAQLDSGFSTLDVERLIADWVRDPLLQSKS